MIELLVATMIASQHPVVPPTPPPAPVVEWCAGAYDVKRGTNFGSCEATPDRAAEVQAPGDVGEAEGTSK